MSQAVLCPQCGKKFGLPARPPATYPCTQCGTVMDLTAFGGASPKPKSPPSAPASDGPRGARRGPRGAARGPVRPPPRRASNDGSPMVLVIVGVIILVLVIVVAVRRDDLDEKLAEKPAPKEEPHVTQLPTSPPPRARPWGQTPSDDASGGAADGAAGGVGRDGSGAAERPAASRLPTGRDGKPRIGELPLAKHAWPDDVPQEVRTRVETSIREVYGGGRDGVEARDWLVEQGRVIAGRLISEFRTIEESPGFDGKEGASMAATIDGILRAMDGQVEALWQEPERIRAWGTFGTPRFITRVARYWNWWWTSGEWQTSPRDPWDPTRDPDEAGASTETSDAEAKAKASKKGWGKRAGGGD